jgi:hypothetical protein
MTNGVHRGSILQADGREYRSVASHSLDSATTSSWYIDEDFAEFARFEETEPRGVPKPTVLEVHQLVLPSLGKSPSEAGKLVAHAPLPL